MLKRSILAQTALGAATAAMCLSTLLVAPSTAAAQTSDSVDVPVPAPPRSDASPAPSAPPAAQGHAQASTSSGHYAQGSNPDYDRRMAEYRARRAEWERENCQAKKAGSTVAGAVFGGIAGALLGSALGGRGYRGTDAAIGGGLGAVTGAAIGSSSTPSCPAGYVYVPRGEYAGGPPPPPPPPYYYGPPPAVVYGPPPPYYYGPPPPYVGFYYGPRWGWRPW